MNRLLKVLFLVIIAFCVTLYPGYGLGMDEKVVSEAVKNLMKQMKKGEKAGKLGVVQSKAAQLKKSPSVFSEIEGKLSSGEPLRIMGKEGEWFQVKLLDSTTGWLHQSDIYEIEPGDMKKETEKADTVNQPGKEEKPSPKTPPANFKNEMVIESENNVMSVNFLNVEIKEALSALALEREINIVTSQQVSGLISVHLFAVGLDEALGAITLAGGFKYKKQGDLYYIYKPKENVDPDLQNLELRTLRLKYAEVDDVTKALDGIQGFRKVKSHKPTGTIIVEDTKENIKKIESLVKLLDAMPKQVMIEVKILEVSLTDDMTFGVNWNDFLYKGAVQIGTGGFSFATQPTTLPVSPVPAVGKGVFGNIITKAGTKEQFSAALEILQAKTKVDTLSTPKILAIHGKPARVQVGGQQGYKVTTTNVGVATETIEFIDTGTILEITPYIDDDGNVLLNVKPSINSAKITSGIPVVNSTVVSTWLMAKNGDTVFIGGLIQDTKTKTREMIPCLGGIPGLGGAFGRTVQGIGKTELIVLITPQILDMESKGKGKDVIKKVKDVEKEFNKDKGSSLKQFWDFLRPVE